MPSRQPPPKPTRKANAGGGMRDYHRWHKIQININAIENQTQQRRYNKNISCGTSPHTAAQPPFLFNLLSLQFVKN